MKNVEILLATFNGGKYIEQQLSSIFSQTYKNFIVTVRDDGSTDDTLEIINKFSKAYPGQINLLPHDGKRLGSTKSFATLLEKSTANYIMFCDQDDYWLEGKIQISLDKLQDLELQYPGKPLMVFSDLVEVDSELNVLSNSFIKSQKLFPSISESYMKLLALNIVAGCTVMINRLSKIYVLPVPKNHIIHDQWIAVNIAYYGKISFISVPTILYRQHSSNSVGANKIKSSYFLKKISNPFRQIRIYHTLISNLNFSVNIFLFIFYKFFFTIKRLR